VKWKNGLRDGKGVQTWPSGSKYEGDWVEDQSNGKGKLTHANGDIYEGDWINDKANGEGSYIHANGMKYVGQWKDDQQHGRDAGDIKSLSYLNDSLCFDSIPLVSLAQKYGTPLYIYSQNSITNSYFLIKEAFSPIDSLTICYAVKSNSNLSILKLLGNLGSGFDIVSEGELLRVLAAGCDPHKIVFSGVGKSTKEI